MATINWQKEVQPLLKKYKNKKFPLSYGNTYELVVMVILAAQDSDAHINKVAPELFKAFPDMKALSKATPETLYPLISKVRNFANKTKWLISLANEIKDDKNIPLTMDELVELPGIGRKSANVILRESGKKTGRRYCRPPRCAGGTAPGDRHRYRSEKDRKADHGSR